MARRHGNKIGGNCGMAGLNWAADCVAEDNNVASIASGGGIGDCGVRVCPRDDDAIIARTCDRQHILHELYIALVCLGVPKDDRLLYLIRLREGVHNDISKGGPGVNWATTGKVDEAIDGELCGGDRGWGEGYGLEHTNAGGTTLQQGAYEQLHEVHRLPTRDCRQFRQGL